MELNHEYHRLSETAILEIRPETRILYCTSDFDVWYPWAAYSDRWIVPIEDLPIIESNMRKSKFASVIENSPMHVLVHVHEKRYLRCFGEPPIPKTAYHQLLEVFSQEDWQDFLLSIKGV